MASWACPKCTFINPPSQKSTCLICLSSSSPSPSTSVPTAPKWSCKSCTSLNPYRNSNCEVCGTRASPSSLLSAIDDDEMDPSVGSVFLPLRPCKRMNCDPLIEVADDLVVSNGLCGIKSAAKAVADTADATLSSTGSRQVKILSYNVWFREDLEVQRRMRALGNLIQLHSPDVICFQEVTPNIYDIFQQSSWWRAYNCSVSNEMAITRGYFCMQLSKLPVKSYSCKPFGNSIMGRELCIAVVEIQPDLPLFVATSHLESPCLGPPKWDQMYSRERVDQAKEAINFLKKNPNVVFCGDMNWDDKLDGQFPLSNGWFDAWVQLRPGEDGWTYDTKSNKMLSANRTLQRRLDRFVCNLRDFEVNGIEMIGMEAIPGLSYFKEKKVKKEMQQLELPVLPSDHYGLLLTICRK